MLNFTTKVVTTTTPETHCVHNLRTGQYGGGAMSRTIGDTEADYAEATREEAAANAPHQAQEPDPYKARVIELVRERNDQDAEMAILRQRDRKPDAFAASDTYVEQCKTLARQELGVEG